MSEEYKTRRFVGRSGEKYRATYDPASFLPKGWTIYRDGSAVAWRKTENGILNYFCALGAKEV